MIGIAGAKERSETVADIYFKGKRINNVAHIGYDPGTADGDYSVMTIMQHDGTVVFVDEAQDLTDGQLQKLNRMIEHGTGIMGHVRYLWAKWRRH